MSAQFSSAYTPVGEIGVQNQIRHVARLMATQMTNAGVGPGVEKVGYVPKKVSCNEAL